MCVLNYIVTSVFFFNIIMPMPISSQMVEFPTQRAPHFGPTEHHFERLLPDCRWSDETQFLVSFLKFHLCNHWPTELLIRALIPISPQLRGVVYTLRAEGCWRCQRLILVGKKSQWKNQFKLLTQIKKALYATFTRSETWNFMVNKLWFGISICNQF